MQHEADDRLNRNPCDFYASVWGDFFLHHPGSAASSQQQVEQHPSLVYDFSSYLSSKYGEAYLDMGILFLEIWGRDIFIWNAYLDMGVPEMSKSSRHSISAYF
jgi:hypothetical protein